MSSGLATTITLAICAIVLAPLALAHRRPRAAAPAALLYAALLLGVGLYHSAIFFPAPALQKALVRNKTAPVSPGSVNAQMTKCAEALELADNAGLILDRSDPERLVVDESLWNSLPALAREVLTTCFEGENPKSDIPVEVITQSQ